MSLMPNFLSIVTISFNQVQYLRECVESVLSQKSSDIEYIIVDPGSTDGSRDILRSYGSAVDRLVLSPDRGPADGLNKGFALATGKVGYFINSDDFLLPGAIDRMRRLWSQRSAMDVLLGGAWMVDGRGEPRRELIAQSADLTALLAGNAPVIQQGMSFRLDCLREVGGFRLENRTCWDYELLCTMLHKGAVAQLTRERIGAFRIYSESLSGGLGGIEHKRRYLADLDRVHRELAGRPFDVQGWPTRAVNALTRVMLRPSSILTQTCDRIFPSRLRDRWKRDVTMPKAPRTS